ncbi:MAG: DUF6465 family protein [Caulobacteraceae bacterium]
MKVNTYVQYHGKEVLTADLEKKVKEVWRQNGHTVKEIDTISLYVKVEDNACYYVVNDTLSGMVPIEG